MVQNRQAAVALINLNTYWNICGVSLITEFENLMMRSLNKKAPRGQGFVEYALILFLVVAVVIVTIFWLGPAIGNMYSNITTSISVLPPYP